MLDAVEQSLNMLKFSIIIHSTFLSFSADFHNEMSKNFDQGLIAVQNTSV